MNRGFSRQRKTDGVLYKGEKGFRGWMNSDNLVELNLENPDLAEIIFKERNQCCVIGSTWESMAGG